MLDESREQVGHIDRKVEVAGVHDCSDVFVGFGVSDLSAVRSESIRNLLATNYGYYSLLPPDGSTRQLRSMGPVVDIPNVQSKTLERAVRKAHKFEGYDTV